jgi:hypothetical protein
MILKPAVWAAPCLFAPSLCLTLGCGSKPAPPANQLGRTPGFFGAADHTPAGIGGLGKEETKKTAKSKPTKKPTARPAA